MGLGEDHLVAAILEYTTVEVVASVTQGKPSSAWEMCLDQASRLIGARSVTASDRLQPMPGARSGARRLAVFDYLPGCPL